MTRFYISYSTARYEGTSDEVLDTIEEVLDFLKERAENEDFRFSVIKGELIEFEPAEVVKAYKVKEKKR
jgi:hypothetical protein